MIYLNEYVKEKTNKMVDVFFELCDKRKEEKGKKIKHASYRIEADIDTKYKLVLMWADSWKLVYKESGAEMIEIKGLPMNALPELIGKFTECIIEDYYMEIM